MLARLNSSHVSSVFPVRPRRRESSRFGYPSWARWVSLLCVLVFGVASTAQAAHIHGGGGAKGVHEVHAPTGGSKTAGDEEHCPLCIAVHWALPATMAAAPAPVLALAVQLRPLTELPAPVAWHFARFSRPPPTLG